MCFMFALCHVFHFLIVLNLCLTYIVGVFRRAAGREGKIQEHQRGTRPDLRRACWLLSCLMAVYTLHTTAICWPLLQFTNSEQQQATLYCTEMTMMVGLFSSGIRCYHSASFSTSANFDQRWNSHGH